MLTVTKLIIYELYIDMKGDITFSMTSLNLCTFEYYPILKGNVLYIAAGRIHWALQGSFRKFKPRGPNLHV